MKKKGRAAGGFSPCDEIAVRCDWVIEGAEHVKRKELPAKRPSCEMRWRRTPSTGDAGFTA